MNQPTMRARYADGNHKVRKKMMPGKKPASATPSRIRTMLRLASPTTKACAADMMPHVNMMRAIQTRAPNLLSARLLGTSKKKYPMKKIPAAPPNTAALNPRSLLSVAFGKADVDAIKIGDEHTNGEDREEAQSDLVKSSLFEPGSRRCACVGHRSRREMALRCVHVMPPAVIYRRRHQHCR
jgi:hypothetical protein